MKCLFSPASPSLGWLVHISFSVWFAVSIRDLSGSTRRRPESVRPGAPCIGPFARRLTPRASSRAAAPQCGRVLPGLHRGGGLSYWRALCAGRCRSGAGTLTIPGRYGKFCRKTFCQLAGQKCDVTIVQVTRNPTPVFFSGDPMTQ